MPARKGKAHQFFPNFFLPGCQEESSEGELRLKQSKQRTHVLAGSLMLACLGMLSLLLVGICIRYGESECTRSDRINKFFLPSQQNNAESTAIECISLWKLQDRSYRAQLPTSRVTEIKTLMAAPTEVCAHMISQTILQKYVFGR